MSTSSLGYRLSATTGIHRGDRAYQQDQVQILPHARVPGCVMGVLADGMGGKSGGRKAADQVILTAQQLFERYSPTRDDPAEALKQLDIVWTPETVSKLFEIGPSAYTPGTKMPEQTIGSAADREALVRFLEKATR